MIIFKGAGKTQSVIETSHAIYMAGHPTLRIDFDQQANLTDYFGHDKEELERPSLTVSRAFSEERVSCHGCEESRQSSQPWQLTPICYEMTCVVGFDN